MFKKMKTSVLLAIVGSLYFGPVMAGPIEDEAVKLTTAHSGPLYVRLQNSFDLGAKGSTRSVEKLSSWKTFQLLFKQGNATREVFQETALRIAREQEEAGTARCKRIQANGGFCMQLTNEANQYGWHAVFNFTAEPELMDEVDEENGTARYNFGPIDKVSVLGTSPSRNDSCDTWVKYRVWLVQNEMTTVGAAFMQANQTESVDQEACYRLGRDGLVVLTVNTLTR